MDIGQKTLGQLSAERNEKKYVTLDTASKISGYTKDYLERLCRLGKMEYRLSLSGQYAPELESLLRETHTILVSFEGIQFSGKEETSDPPAVVHSSNISQPEEPTTSSVRSEEKKNAFTFVTRPVLSRAVEPRSAAASAPTPVPASSSVSPAELPQVSAMFQAPRVAVSVQSGEEEGWESLVRPVAKPVSETLSPRLARESSETIHKAVHLEIFDADMLARHRDESPSTPRPTGMPTGIVPSKPGQNLPIPEPQRHLTVIDPHPVIRNPALNIALIALVAIGFGLVGLFASVSPQKQEQVAQNPSNEDLVASVASVFSDDVIIRQKEAGVVGVTPVFRDREGQERDFLLIPVRR